MKSSFNERCYGVLRKVPRGKITTYKDLAEALHCRAYRAVGNAMRMNPHAPKVPCHRVVKSNGKAGEFALGTKKKIEMLRKEGIKVKDGLIENFEKVLYKFRQSGSVSNN